MNKVLAIKCGLVLMSGVVMGSMLPEMPMVEMIITYTV